MVTVRSYVIPGVLCDLLVGFSEVEQDHDLKTKLYEYCLS